MNNKGLITATIIGGCFYLGGKVISIKAANNRTKEMATSLNGLYDKMLTWCDKYMTKLGIDMTD